MLLSSHVTSPLQIIISLVLLNLLIAIMGETFHRILDKGKYLPVGRHFKKKFIPLAEPRTDHPTLLATRVPISALLEAVAEKASIILEIEDVWLPTLFKTIPPRWKAKFAEYTVCSHSH
jgi:hypothetical protein